MECKKIAFVNGKGGCGKTTSLFHLVGVLAKKNQRVLVIDLDKQRNSTDVLLMDNENKNEYTILDVFNNKVEFEQAINKVLFKSRSNASPKYYGVDMISADVRLDNSKNLKNVDIKEKFNFFIEKEKYDWVLIDMPPSSEKINHICFTQMTDYIIVPFTSDFFSINGYGDLMNVVNKAREARNLNKNLNILGVFLSRFMNNCKLDEFIQNELKENFGDMYIDVQIPERAEIREAVMFGRPISFYKSDNSNSLSRLSYEKLAEVIEEKIENMKRR